MRRLPLLAGLLPALALAHGGDIDSAGQWQDLPWTWEPWFIVTLLLAGALYGGGLLRLRRQGLLRLIGPWRVAAFVAAMLALVAALASPLDTLSEQLFSAHMVQHLLLMLVIAPLLVLARPALAGLWLLPLPGRRRSGRAWQVAVPHLRRLFANAGFVWTANTFALWFWHMTGPYEWALRNDTVHIVEHLSFLAVALGMWQLVFAPLGQRRLGHGAALLFLGTQALQSTLLGAYLAFASHPLYPSHLLRTQVWGLSPLEDQQLAGLIMWIPAGMVFLLAMTFVFADWLQLAGRRNAAAMVVETERSG